MVNTICSQVYSLLLVFIGIDLGVIVINFAPLINMFPPLVFIRRFIRLRYTIPVTAVVASVVASLDILGVCSLLINFL